MAVLNFCAVSDIHQRLDRLPALGPVLAAADWVLLLGDLTQFGHRREAAVVLEAFRTYNPRLLAVPGNLDQPDVLSLLREEGCCLHGESRRLDTVGLAGLGGSNPTPFGTPFELSEESIATVLGEPLRAIAADPVRIVVSHPPPRGTAVDRIRLGLHAGSRSVRQLVEEQQPDLLLCGHIHEAAGEDRLGRTCLLNPGPLARGGYIWVDVDAGGVRASLKYLE